MTQDYEALKEEAKRAIDRIETSEHDVPISFVRDTFDSLDEFFLSILRPMKEICENEQYQPTRKTNEHKRDILRQMQFIRAYQERIYSEDVFPGIYYFLNDVINDTNGFDAIAIEAGHEIKTYRLRPQFDVIETVAFWRTEEELDVEPQIITFPRHELWNPLNYSLIAHEIFHTSHVVDELIKYFEYLDVSVPEDELEEVCVDLLTLNYIGPAYAPALKNIHDKIGEHEAPSHPSIETRIEYIYDFLQVINNKTESTDIMDKVFENAENDISDIRDSAAIDYSIDEKEALQEEIERLLDIDDIDTFIDIHDGLANSLGMPNTTEQKLKNHVYDLLDIHNGDEEPKPIAIPVKPTLLFNLLLLIDDRYGKGVRLAVLSSFKKWYVKREFSQK